MFENKQMLRKMVCVLVAMLLFVVVSSPFVYKLVNKVLPVSDVSGCPTKVGLLVHSLVFGLLLALVCMILCSVFPPHDDDGGNHVVVPTDDSGDDVDDPVEPVDPEGGDAPVEAYYNFL